MHFRLGMTCESCELRVVTRSEVPNLNQKVRISSFECVADFLILSSLGTALENSF
jgi:hypothetical protein